MIHNKDADCPLLRAMRSKNLEVVRLLLLSVDACQGSSTDIQEMTAFSMELVKSMPEASERDVRDLITKKADLNYRDENGWTALIAAVFWGKKDSVEAILKHPHATSCITRMKIDMPNANGHSALHIAARKGRDDIIPLLIAGRSNPNLRDKDGWTPLHHASFNGMDEALQALLTAQADVTIQSHLGFTPWMVSALPTHSGTLQPASLKLIEPSDSISFSKKVIPIISNSALTPYEKLEELFQLPGVTCNAANLRLHEHFFSPKHGPNKVRLTKMWEGLASDLLLRLRSGEADTAAPGECLSEDQEQERARRWRDQTAFLEHWFKETRGPPPSEDWTHDNRECYRTGLDTLITAEAAGFFQEFSEIYAKLQQDEFGKTLCRMPICEVLRPEYLTQLSAHPILSWIDTLDTKGAFYALANLNALGPSKEINDQINNFVDLIYTNHDFNSSAGFWSNVYKLWLHHYAQMAQQDFQRRVLSVVNAFNDKYKESEDLRADYCFAPVKSYERMKVKEAELGVVNHTTHAGRWVASGILDVIRMSVTVNRPRAAVILLNEFFRPMTLLENRIQLVRVVNNFHEEAETSNGYRDVVLNMYFDGGTRSVQRCSVAFSSTGTGAVQDIHLSLVGEVQLVLQEFSSVKKRMHLITRYSSGEFDHKPRSPEQRPASPQFKGEESHSGSPG